MTTPSNAAKAAALMHHVSGIDTSAKALEIYNELETCYGAGGDMVEVLDKHETPVWEGIDHLSMSDVWDNIWQLACSIDICREELT